MMSAFPRFRSTAIAVATLLVVALGSPALAASTPAKPTGLKAAPTTSGATLSWSAAKNAKTYSICLLTSNTTTKCTRAYNNLTKTSLVIGGLKPTGGKDYYFKVRSINGTLTAWSGKVGFDLKPAPRLIKPAAVTGMKHVVSSDSVTVSWPAAKGANGYTVCLIATATAEICTVRSIKSATRSATIEGITPTSYTDYYYRVYSYRNSASAYSAKGHFDLPVSAVPGFNVPAFDNTSISYAWDAASNAGSYQLQVATNVGMTSGVKTFILRTRSYKLTKLIPGTAYYYRIRGLNDAVKGAFTKATGTRVPSDPFTAVVVTYNLCGQNKCVNSTNGMRNWSTRKALAGTIVRSIGADVIATQESQTKETNFGTELPGFALASYYSAKSLYYKTSKYTKLRSGAITLDSLRNRYAVWAELQDKATMSKFLVSDAHLEPYKNSSTYPDRDNIRYAQTRVLLAQIAKVNTGRLPVVYAGDFNSNKANANTKYVNGYDAPLQAFTEAGILDSFSTAGILTNPSWNSSNQAKNPPIKHFDHIDHVFVDPRILTQAWKVVVTVTDSNYTTPFASDHNPVRAILTIPGRS